MLIPILFLSMVFLFLPSISQAANHYIRQGGVGTGADWTNALGTWPTTFVRGDVYYIADGTYAGTTFKTVESGNQYITIKKATQADHGTATGWQTTYGDGKAVFSSTISFNTDYWIFNGQTGGGPNSWNSGLGFMISPTSCTSAYKHYYINNGADYITISHTETVGCGGGELDSKDDHIYAVNNADGGSSNITISYNYFHHTSRTFVLSNYASNWIVEYNHFYYTGSAGASHRNGISANYCPQPANYVIRYNYFKDVRGTNAIGIKDSVQSHFYIYGNIFQQTASNFIHSGGVVSNTYGDTNTYMYVYNNTMININGSPSSGITFYNGTNNYAYNNIWYNCTGVSFLGVTHDYNAFSGTNAFSESHAQTGITSSIFKNFTGNDFTLNSATQAGLSQVAPFNQDIKGQTRGADEVWDRGAYEYNSGAIPTCTIQGDVDCNQRVEATDIQIAINVFLGLENNSERINNSDVNDDQKTDVSDIQKIINIVLNI